MQELVASLWAVSDPADALPAAVQRVATLFGVPRAGLVLLTADGRTGFLVASTEDPNLLRAPFAAVEQPALHAAVAERAPKVSEDPERELLLSDGPIEDTAGRPLWLFPTPPGQATGALVIDAPAGASIEDPSLSRLGIGCAAMIASAL